MAHFVFAGSFFVRGCDNSINRDTAYDRSISLVRFLGSIYLVRADLICYGSSLD